jgi:threonine aldolase
MYTYSFFNDYSEGVHPAILDLLTKTNLDQEPGYGDDSISTQAKELIKTSLGNADVDIHFVSGGTQANLIILASLMKPYESVIAANTAHISIHEAGAIEATGHKINAVEVKDGKLTVEDIKKVFESHTDEHMVKPKVVFVSQSTELGTVYTRAELEAISTYCHSHNLFLHLDGARLGSALTSTKSDLTLADIVRLTDIFYIGGTKNGALFGEAIVISNPELKANFRYYLKQHGALLAKGRAVGAQFVGLFTNNLYFDLAKHANTMAAKLGDGIRASSFGFLTESSTNQIFPIFPDTLIAKLQESYGFYVWARVDDAHSAIRLVTSWATKEEKVDEFLKDLQHAKENQS